MPNLTSYNTNITESEFIKVLLNVCSGKHLSKGLCVFCFFFLIFSTIDYCQVFSVFLILSPFVSQKDPRIKDTDLTLKEKSTTRSVHSSNKKKCNLYCVKILIYGCLSGKQPACQCRRCRFNPWVRKIPWSKKWQPTPIFWWLLYIHYHFSDGLNSRT